MSRVKVTHEQQFDVKVSWVSYNLVPIEATQQLRQNITKQILYEAVMEHWDNLDEVDVTFVSEEVLNQTERSPKEMISYLLDEGANRALDVVMDDDELMNIISRIVTFETGLTKDAHSLLDESDPRYDQWFLTWSSVAMKVIGRTADKMYNPTPTEV